MFIENKYLRWYQGIITNAKNRKIDGYSEVHHIVPKSLGGSNDKTNLVNLTAREHFMCHLLLIKMTNDENKKKMARALWLMAKGSKNRYHPSSRLYEVSRKAFVDAQKGHPNYLKSQKQKSRDKISASMSAMLQQMSQQERSERTKKSASSPESWTQERRQKISASLKDREFTEEHRNNISIGTTKYRASLPETLRIDKYGSSNKGKTWKIIDGKRVWISKEN